MAGRFFIAGKGHNKNLPYFVSTNLIISILQNKL
jgi:hypothetical protein